MIAFRGVTKRYGPPGRGVAALSDVSLEIPPGSVWGVVGPNGAGKSTLFALLLGFVHATEGMVLVGDDSPRTYLRKHGAAYLPERFHLPPEWTVRAALGALARLDGMPAAEAERRAGAVLERLELDTQAAQPLGTLSRGTLQRVGLAQALLGEHALVVLDEPTEGLDPLWRIRFRAMVEELRADGRTILIASHDLVEVERLADRAVLLERGRVKEILDTAPSAERQRYTLRLAAPAAEAVAEAFPGAEALEGEVAYLVSVADAVELSRRLAAMLEAGATIAAVAPYAEPLEERVRRALGGQA